MDRVEIPDTLDEMSEDELRALADAIAQAADDMSSEAAGNEDSVSELERLAGEFERISDHLAEREVLASERQSRAEAAMDRFAKADTDPEDATDPVDPAEEAGENPDGTPIDGKVILPPKKAAADTEDSAEFMAPTVPADTAAGTASAPAQPGVDATATGAVPSVKVNAEKMLLADVESSVEMSAEASIEATIEIAEETALVVLDESTSVELAVEESSEVVELTTEEVVAEVPAPVELTSEADTTLAVEETSTTNADEADSKEMSVADIAAVPTTEALNAAVDAAPGASTTMSTASAAGATRPFSTLQADGQDIDVKELSKRICDARLRMSNTPSGVFEYVTLAQGTHEYPSDRMVSQAEEANFAIFESIREEAQALVASGGTCAPLTPSYDIFRLAEPQSPVENALPSVGATRGGIRYIVPPAFTQASGGVRVTTNAQDIAGYTSQTPSGSTDPKPCVSVVCPGVNDVFVDAVSQCVQFGNLNYRVFPEQVESFMKDLAVVFAQTKEIKYLDAIDANSTSVNLTPDYGATRAITFALSQLTWAYRKRNHMATNATLDVYLPDSVLPLLKADMVNDWALGLNFLDASVDDVKRMVFTKLNVNAVFYYDYATGDLPNMQQAQATGTAVPFLASIRAYIFAPGTFVRLDGGTLDVGIVRDSALNGTNNLQIFAEEWIQVAKVGLESIRANITLCPSGTGPAAKTALICAS